MVRSTDDGPSSVAPFLRKCYDMVDDESTDSIICWSGSSDNCFVIRDMTEFSVRLLPNYFKHSNFSSFIRQLNIYGFRKMDADRWEFANDGFVRDQKHLLKTICRRKNPHRAEQWKHSDKQEENKIEPTANVENPLLWKEVENLKADKNVLMHELIKLRQQQESADNKLLLLKDQLQGMERSQQQMLSFLVSVMQSPALLVHLLQPEESKWRMADQSTRVEEVIEEGEELVPDGQIVRYQPPLAGAPMTSAANAWESDNASDGLKDFLVNGDLMKVLMEENHAPSIPLDVYNDGLWEQFLLASAFRERHVDGGPGHDREALANMESTEIGMESDGNDFCELLQQPLEKSGGDDHGVGFEKSRAFNRADGTIGFRPEVIPIERDRWPPLRPCSQPAGGE